MRNCLPFAAFCTDPCDGRTQGTTGMMDSLPYRNDAAQVFRRQIRSLPTRHGVMGVATCDKGLPAMMMALAGTRNLPCILVPGGVTLPPEFGEDAGAVQSLGARFAHGEVSWIRPPGPLHCLCFPAVMPFLGPQPRIGCGRGLGLSLIHTALALQDS
jgi:dihydroxyacid dehydratase/phosphogluconate dehydratase